MSKVDLFILGAAKSGTTSFHEYLNQHPNIEMSSVKEPNFFSYRKIMDDDLYYKGAPMIKSLKNYTGLFETKSKIKGESSVSYLFYEETAEKIYRYNSQAKLLVFLRNPIDRAFSHYLMDYSAGYVKEKFLNIVNNKQLNPIAYQQFVEYGYYGKHISRYLDVFPRDQIKVIIFEEAIQNLEVCLEQIENFLDIREFDNYNFEVKNSYSFTNNTLIKAIYTSPGLKHLFKKIISRKLVEKLKDLFLKAPKPSINKDGRLYLKELYKKDIERLSLICNKDLIKIWKL